MLLRVGTRGSKLSLVQTDIVLEQLKRKDHKLVVERKIIKTRGDEDQRTPIFSINQKGIFEKEIDQAILEGKIDVAVHSLKDVPVFEVDTKLVIASVPQRGSPSNVLVSKNGERRRDLKSGSRVGTSSLLRVAQLKRVRPDLQTVPIRGNVDTRLQKVEDGEFDAVILAEAGVLRLGLTGRIAERLSLDDFMPAPGQGILALIARQDNRKVLELLRSIEDPPTRAPADAERTIRDLHRALPSLDWRASGLAGTDERERCQSLIRHSQKSRKPTSERPRRSSPISGRPKNKGRPGEERNSRGSFTRQIQLLGYC